MKKNKKSLIGEHTTHYTTLKSLYFLVVETTEGCYYDTKTICYEAIGFKSDSNSLIIIKEYFGRHPLRKRKVKFACIDCLLKYHVNDF